MQEGRLDYWLKLFIIFSAYFITARIGLSIDAVSGFATLVWPPAGIALAALLIWGKNYWPAVALGALTANLLNGAPLLVGVGISTGNTLEALLGAYLLTRFVGFNRSLERVNDVLGLVLLAGLVSTSVAATIGTTSLYIGDIVTAETYNPTWIAWWVGDILGVLIVAPLILVWKGQILRALKSELLIKAIIIAICLIIASVLIIKASFWVDAEPFTFTYLIYPFLIWLALRFGQRGNVSAVFVVSVVAIWSTIMDFDTISGQKLSQTLLLFQIFMGITAATFMTMAAVVAEHERSLKHQQRLIQKAAILKKQRARLMDLNQAKDEFIGLASHQLRTPATGVKQYVGMLLDNYAGKLMRPQRAILRKAYDCNEREIQIINELLAIAQIDAGDISLNIEKFDLTQLVSDVLESHSVFLKSRRQTVSLKHAKRNFFVLADKARLKMVIENIIDNASKYSPKKSHIEIIINKYDGIFSIAVRDDGVGIAKKDISKLFKKFSRVDNPFSLDVGGSGLGLYLAKKIMTLHGGTIDVSSQVGQGSVFTIALPLKSR
jgi:signal transduction histidine kinase